MSCSGDLHVYNIMHVNKSKQAKQMELLKAES